MLSRSGAVREIVCRLVARVLGIGAGLSSFGVPNRSISSDSAEAGEVYDLWLKVYTRSADGTYAWKVTMAAMLSDLRVAFY